MPFFSETAAAALQKRVVRMATLVLLDFTSGPIRVFGGTGKLDAGGQVWSGLGELGSISGVQLPTGSTAPVATLTLSGVDPRLLAAALDAPEEVTDRPAVIYVQFFDEINRTLDQPYAVFSGFMDQMPVEIAGPDSASISLTIEWLLTRRAKTPFSMLSDRDQKARFPGDRGLEHIITMQNKSTYWPVFP